MYFKKIYPVLLLTAVLSSISAMPPETKFNAVYDCAFNADSVYITKAVISKNGNVIVFCGWNNHKKPVLFKMGANGSGLLNFELPEYVYDNPMGIQDITISNDGTVAYFYSGYRIYKIVSNVLTQIFDSEEDDSDEILRFSNLQSSSNGNIVYFKLDEGLEGGSVWQLDIEGLHTIKVIDPADVKRNNLNNDGAGLSNYAVADNGYIAFILDGYWDDTHNFVSKPEIFLQILPLGLGYRQLTFDSKGLNKNYLYISGNGAYVLHHKKSLSDTSACFLVDSSGLYNTKLFNIDIPGSAGMNFSGATIFVSNSYTQGRLIFTDGPLTVLDVVPKSLGVDSRSKISYSYANRVCVYNNNKGSAGVYVGYLYCQGSFMGSPNIEDVSFDPPVFPINEPDTRIKLMAAISDPNGLENINDVYLNILYEGVNRNSGYNFSQVYFPLSPNDAGTFKDSIAGDGIYTTEGVKTPYFEESDKFNNQVYIRVTAHNKDRDFTIRDVLLNIDYWADIDHQPALKAPREFHLSQNYPNPFNPSTKIGFTIPGKCRVSLKIYDQRGREIAELLNEKKSAGKYEIEYFADDLASGIYYYRLQAENFTDTKKFILLK